jgi:23S rRNA U2552 (ribose-2'-O)-methylase RlmE/FtsJ
VRPMSQHPLRRARTLASAQIKRGRTMSRRIAGDRYARRLPAGQAARPVRPATNPLTDYFQGQTTGPGILKPLHYFEVYHRHLAKFVGRSVNVVEIGVYSGGSLAMWQHYFGARAHLYGVDIEQECRRHQSEHVDIIIGDQGDPAFWADFRRRVPTVDVVLDDGGHQAHQQIPTLEGLLPHMADGGVYICEDVGGVDNGLHAYVEGLSRNIHATGDHTTGFQQTVHSVHLYPYMVVVEKPDVPVSAFTDEARGSDWASFAPVAFGHADRG